MSAPLATALTRWWTRLYTVGLPAEVRAARRAEIESDLWESLHDPDIPQPHILPRLAAGILDDVSWRAGHLPDESRAVSLTLAAGCLLLVAMWEWLARPAIMAMIVGSTWIYPIAESLHVLGITVFLGLTVILDLRLLGVTLRRVPPSELVRETLPWTAPAGLLSIVTGMVLFVAEPGRFIGNVFFQIKAIALLLAVVTILLFHLAVYPRVHDWDEHSAPPRGARLCAACSLTLWAVLLVASRLVAYAWFR